MREPGVIKKKKKPLNERLEHPVDRERLPGVADAHEKMFFSSAKVRIDRRKRRQWIGGKKETLREQKLSYGSVVGGRDGEGGRKGGRKGKEGGRKGGRKGKEGGRKEGYTLVHIHAFRKWTGEGQRKQVKDKENR